MNTKAIRPASAPRVCIGALTAQDQQAFLSAVALSRRLHRPWSYPPATPERFRALLAKQAQGNIFTYAIRLRAHGGKDGGDLAGLVSISEIVRGNFLNAYLGYYAFTPYAGQGLMREGLSLVIQQAFAKLKLHRLEANIQPGNEASRQLVQKLGFQLEGYSPRYLRIGGRWRDHERWAITREDWRAARRQLRGKGEPGKNHGKSR